MVRINTSRSGGGIVRRSPPAVAPAADDTIECYEHLRTDRPRATSGQSNRANRLLRETPAGAAGARGAPVAGRDRTADLRERVGPGLEALGRASEDDPERISSDAVAEGGAGADSQAPGGVLLRRRRGTAARLRPAAVEGVRIRPPHQPAGHARCGMSMPR